MPTGYTADVGDGKVTELREFAWGCARAFGACIHLRDVDEKKERRRRAPVLAEPTTYHLDKIEEAKKELAQIEAMSLDQKREAHAAYIDETVSRSAKYQRGKLETEQRYSAMIEKVRAWTPPTPDHEELKKFMLEQLRESIRFDCGHVTAEKVMPFHEYWSHRLARIARDIEYHTQEHAKEVERVESRNAWTKKLDESLSQQDIPSKEKAR